MVMTTMLYAALLGLLLIALAVNVIRGRYKYRAALGDAGEFEMQRRIRAHANLTEYAPMFLIMLWLAEYHGLPVYFVHLFGLAFSAGRVSHAYSLLKHEQYKGKELLNVPPVFRSAGMIATFTTIGLLAIILIVQYFSRG